MILETLDMHLIVFLKLNLDFHHAYFVFEFFFTLILAICFEINLNFFELYIPILYLNFLFCTVRGERIVNKNAICTEISSREKKKKRKRNLKGEFEDSKKFLQSKFGPVTLNFHLKRNGGFFK